MMKKLGVFLLTLALFSSTSSFANPQGAGGVRGVAQNAQSQALSGVKVQLRNVDTGQLAGTTTSAQNGAFSFTGLNPGNFVVEIVDGTGRIIGVSSSLTVTGGVISGVTVAASAAGALSGAAAAGGLGAFFTSTGGILALVGVGAGAAAAIGLANASPSR